MPISQYGQLNTTALVVPNVYVVIIPPSVANLNGVPTNVIGIVGTASWGPVNVATTVGTYAQYASIFGPVIARSNDIGTGLSCAILQGASNFQIVRVTDGTDVAASVVVPTTAITFHSIYTGSYGNNTVVTIGPGTKASSTKAVVTLGSSFEVFDNLTGTGNALWVVMANAINNGQNSLRGPSQLITAVAGSGTTAPPTTATNYDLAGGTDGVTTITSATLVGANTSPATGMYALANQGVSIGILQDLTDNTQWTTIESFGLSQGIYFITSGPAGDVISTSSGTISTRNSSGADSYALKILFGDWIYWNDPVNQVLRLVSPPAFAAGLYANLSPEQSGLNKQLYGIVGTQRSTSTAGNGTYADAELQLLFQNGIDVICNPCPGGSYFGLRSGHNCSSQSTIWGDNYTRMTNYIASTLNKGMGIYVGQLINQSTFNNVTATLTNFLMNMLGSGMLAYTSSNSLPFSVVCNASNNSFSQTSIGYLTATVNIQYQAINEKFIINLQGGQGVTITSSLQNAA